MSSRRRSAGGQHGPESDSDTSYQADVSARGTPENAPPACRSSSFARAEINGRRQSGTGLPRSSRYHHLQSDYHPFLRVLTCSGCTDVETAAVLAVQG